MGVEKERGQVAAAAPTQALTGPLALTLVCSSLPTPGTCNPCCVARTELELSCVLCPWARMGMEPCLMVAVVGVRRHRLQEV